jgi:hypothetical protein
MHPPAAVNISQEQQAVPGSEVRLCPHRHAWLQEHRRGLLGARRRPESTLVVLGGLPSGTWPSNIVGLKDLSDAQLRWVYANCSALVAVALEDFGLTVPEVAPSVARSLPGVPEATSTRSPIGSTESSSTSPHQSTSSMAWTDWRPSAWPGRRARPCSTFRGTDVHQPNPRRRHHGSRRAPVKHSGRPAPRSGSRSSRPTAVDSCCGCQHSRANAPIDTAQRGRFLCHDHAHSGRGRRSPSGHTRPGRSGGVRIACCRCSSPGWPSSWPDPRCCW